jgi:hypothetical protein
MLHILVTILVSLQTLFLVQYIRIIGILLTIRKCVCYMNLRRHCLLYTKFIVSNQSSIKKKKIILRTSQVQQISTIQYEEKEFFLWKGEGAQAKRDSMAPVVKLLNSEPKFVNI